jgi:hypothetical protein
VNALPRNYPKALGSMDAVYVGLRFPGAADREGGSAAVIFFAPGEYKLFAWDSIESNAELNAEYMRGYENLGTPVRIAPGENPSVPLRLIRMSR